MKNYKRVEVSKVIYLEEENIVNELWIRKSINCNELSEVPNILVEDMCVEMAIEEMKKIDKDFDEEEHNFKILKK